MIDNKLLKSIESKKNELDKYRPFPKSVIGKLNEQFIIEWTFNSNAIEGNTLSVQETELVLNRGITISGKTLREHFEALNHKEGIIKLEDFINKKSDFSKEIILELHKIILKNIDDNEAGYFRKHNVRIIGANHIPPNYIKIPHLIEELVDWYFEFKYKINPVELAALIHYKFVFIHPFIDGNGRTARLLMNLILIQNGYPPAIILNVDKKKYYKVLKEADDENFANYFNFIAKAVDRSLIIYLHSLKPSDNENYEKQGYITLAEAAKYCNFSQEYLSLLARKGKLSAVKFNRNWMTTREAVEEYVNTHK